MASSQLLAQMFQSLMDMLSSFWFLIPVLLLLALFKSAWFKGVMGELLVSILTKLCFDSKEYQLFKNVTLPTENGTTQIDHIIVSKYGLFVVETKNMKGWIFGQPRQKMWTQKIYKHTSQFQNPLHQNYKHTKTIEQLLSLQPHQWHSVVVFIGNSTFKTPMPDNVTHGLGYIRYVKSKKEIVFTEQELKSITAAIGQERLAPTLKTHREHVKHVKSIVADEQNTQIPVCPKCGSKMVLRTAKKGVNVGNKFWGCANFPNCRGIVKYDNA